MNCWVLIILATMLLCVPRALLPREQVSASKRARPEIHGWLTVLHWMTIAYCGLWHRLKTNGWAPLPETGPAILIANHTCGIDHLILQAGCRRVLGFMIAREYYEWRKISYFCKDATCRPPAPRFAHWKLAAYCRSSLRERSRPHQARSSARCAQALRSSRSARAFP